MWIFLDEIVFVDKKHQSKSVDETLIVKIPNQISPHKKKGKKTQKKKHQFGQ
jgi:hypothetical protein